MNPSLKYLAVLSFWNLILITLALENKTEAPLISVPQGMIRGITEKDLNGTDFYSYKSIPYAKAPLGSLRFKDPVPLMSWEGLLDGTKEPSPCLHHTITDFVKTNNTIPFYGREDCLILNVYTPMPNKEAKLPVMVYIHGGSFIGGRSSSYTGQVLLQEKIVLVTIQYRLGILGFLSTEDSIIPGNMGLKDQQLALKWVKENIVNFGGNPNTVTLFGNSAGAASIHFHIFSPLSKGLFQRAILQSGNALCPWASSMNHRNFARDAGQKFGCDLKENIDVKYLQCMQSVKARDLIQFTTDTGVWGVAPIYVLPRVDGVFLPDHPENLLKQKRYNKVEMMMGITKDDGSVILGTMLIDPISMFKLVTNFDRNSPFSLLLHEEEKATELATQAYKYYLKRNSTIVTLNDVNALLGLCKDRYFGMCHDISLNFLSKEKDINLYAYQFEHFGEFSDASSIAGLDRKDFVIHGDDIYYFFEGSIPYHKPMKNEQDLLMREIMVTAWTNFASTGNPNSAEFDFQWEPFSATNKRILRLTTSPTMMDYSFEERNFWTRLETRQNERLNFSLNVLT